MIITVLKIIGIILLAVLGLLIFMIGLFLFLPICYRFDGTYDKQLNGEAVVKWIPVLLKAKVTVVNGKPIYVVKLLGGVLATNTGKKLSWIGRKIFPADDETPFRNKNKAESKKEAEDNKETVSYQIIPQDHIEFEEPKSPVKKKKKISVFEK